MEGKVFWSAKNNSSFLNGRREAKSLRAAVQAARRYVRYELNGEGEIAFFAEGDLNNPIRVDRRDAWTGYRWDVQNF